MAENQLQKNTLRLGEFEKRIQDLNSITSNIKTKVDGEIEEIAGLKMDIINIKNGFRIKRKRRRKKKGRRKES